MTGTIYNSTDGPLLIDRAGRVLGARERRDDVDLEASPVAGHLAAGRLIVLDGAQADADAPKGKPSARRTTPTTQEA